MVHPDIRVLGRCNGMGELDTAGSYVKLSIQGLGHAAISVGAAEVLAGELGSLKGAAATNFLASRDPEVVALVVRLREIADNAALMGGGDLTSMVLIGHDHRCATLRSIRDFLDQANSVRDELLGQMEVKDANA